MIKLYFGGHSGFSREARPAEAPRSGSRPTRTALDAYCELMDGQHRSRGRSR